MKLTRTIAAIATAAAITTCIAGIKPAYTYLAITRPHQRTVDEFAKTSNVNEYNTQLYSFALGSRFEDYFTGAPDAFCNEFKIETQKSNYSGMDSDAAFISALRGKEPSYSPKNERAQELTDLLRNKKHALPK